MHYPPEGQVTAIKRLKGPYQLILLLLLSFGVYACKPNKDTPEPTKSRTEQQQLLDSVYHYYKLYSLWENDLGIADKDVLQFTDQFQSAEALLAGLKGKTPYFAAYNGGVDRFSIIEDLQIPNYASSTFGLYLSIAAYDDHIAYPIVYFVEGNSPAYLAGIKRSDMIQSVNDHIDLSIPISCTNGSCSITDQKRYQEVKTTLDNALLQSSLPLQIKTQLAESHAYNLTERGYTIKAIQKEKVFFPTTNPTGYFLLSSFEDVEYSYPHRQQIDELFEGFKQQNIKELIVDLRYNQGGYVDAAAYIANYIKNQQAEGKLMIRYQTNSYLASNPAFIAGIFDDENFNNNSPLALNKVYFLVSNETASASELLINILKPYMPVTIIAVESATYGKPVGFFRQEIMGKIGLWVASFKMLNGAGVSDYWSGIAADIKNVEDNIFRDFGDPEEDLIAAALKSSGGNPALARSSIAPLRSKTSRSSIARLQSLPARGLIKKIK